MEQRWVSFADDPPICGGAVACSPAATDPSDTAWDCLPTDVLGLKAEASLGESVRGIFQQCDAIKAQRAHGCTHELVGELVTSQLAVSGAFATAASLLGSSAATHTSFPAAGGDITSNAAAAEAVEYLNRVLGDLYCDGLPPPPLTPPPPTSPEPAASASPSPSPPASPADLSHTCMPHPQQHSQEAGGDVEARAPSGVSPPQVPCASSTSVVAATETVGVFTRPTQADSLGSPASSSAAAHRQEEESAGPEASGGFAFETSPVRHPIAMRPKPRPPLGGLLSLEHSNDDVPPPTNRLSFARQSCTKEFSRWEFGKQDLLRKSNLTHGSELREARRSLPAGGGGARLTSERKRKRPIGDYNSCRKAAPLA
jgi:hypothetical protein